MESGEDFSHLYFGKIIPTVMHRMDGSRIGKGQLMRAFVVKV